MYQQTFAINFERKLFTIIIRWNSLSLKISSKLNHNLKKGSKRFNHMWNKKVYTKRFKSSLIRSTHVEVFTNEAESEKNLQFCL